VANKLIGGLESKAVGDELTELFVVEYKGLSVGVFRSYGLTTTRQQLIAPRHFDSMVHSDASPLNASPTAISMPGSHSNRRLAASVGRMALGLLRLLVSRCEAKDVDW